MSGGEQWYTNKELFEMINDLTDELRATQTAVKQYNDLRRQLSGHETELSEHATRLAGIEQRASGAASVGKGIREWGGWIVGLASLLFAIWRARQ